MLKFNGTWRFDSPGEFPNEVVAEFSTLIGKIAARADRSWNAGAICPILGTKW
jgi:hypothetical protein